MTPYERHCKESDVAGLLIRKYLSNVDCSLFWEDKHEMDEEIAANVHDYLSMLGAGEYIALLGIQSFVNYYMIAWELFAKARISNKDEAYRQGYTRFY